MDKNSYISDLIYIIGCQCSNKECQVIKKFNISDLGISHIGILILKNDQLMVHSVTPSSESRKSDLIVERLDEFEVQYDSVMIWKSKIGCFDLKAFENTLRKIIKLDIKYDFDFNSHKGEEFLYCSSFVTKILNSSLNEGFSRYKESHRLLGKVYARQLGRRVLNYYPVDFFMQRPYFEHL